MSQTERDGSTKQLSLPVDFLFICLVYQLMRSKDVQDDEKEKMARLYK